MTESTQLQTNENNNTSVVKMEAPPPPVSPAPSEQQYALKWNDFQTSILSSFRHLRDEEDFVDVTLACDQRSYRAHKVVLSACSPYFRKLLKANPCEHPIVILRDVKSEDVESLLRFMYNGEVHVNQEHLSDFLKTAQLLQVRGLADVNGSPTSMGPVSSNIPAAITSTSTTNTSYTNSNNNINNNTNNNNNNNNSNSGNNNNNNSNNNNNINNNLSTSSSSTTITPQPITANSLLLNASLNTPSSLNITNTNSNTSTSQSASSPAISIKTPLALSNSVSTTALSSSTTPAIQELKASPVRRIKNAWDIDERQNHLTPPPQKRIKSADLYRAQHGISPERFLVSNDLPLGQHPLHRERDRTRDSSRDTSRDRDRSLELRDTLLGQALENSAQQLGVNQKHPDLASLQAQSTGEDSNSSDTEPSDRGDGQLDGTIDSVNGSLDNRSHSFPSAFLGLQNIPGLLAGPSGMHSDNFDLHNSKIGLIDHIKKEVIDSEEFMNNSNSNKLILNKENNHKNNDKKSLRSRTSSSPGAQSTHSLNDNNNRDIDAQYNQKGNNNKEKNIIGSNIIQNINQITNNEQDEQDYDEEDDISTHSSLSAISLTVNNKKNNKNLDNQCDPIDTVNKLLFQQQQQQQQQQHQEQHLQEHSFLQRQHENFHQQHQQFADDFKTHHHQLTANLLMARAIGLGRTRDLPELLQNASAAVNAINASRSDNRNNDNNGNSTNTGGGGGYLLPCPLCETPLEPRIFRQHLDRHYPRDSPVCPVIQCGRRFAHPNSVRNHMRIKHTLQWAKMKAMRSSGGPFTGMPDYK
ncbi:protein abrupt isoform X4 [Condylostylus longicornis]|uniref:protein abrupt isoform X4 n=1 Tax=Condylostylus longicornis TaxID=2530218 RepID=UPI00244E1D27|nr:protein abrupt isoform X4 [Condylostylus longicornis]